PAILGSVYISRAFGEVTSLGILPRLRRPPCGESPTHRRRRLLILWRLCRRPSRTTCETIGIDAFFWSAATPGAVVPLAAFRSHPDGLISTRHFGSVRPGPGVPFAASSPRSGGMTLTRPFKAG